MNMETMNTIAEEHLRIEKYQHGSMTVIMSTTSHIQFVICIMEPWTSAAQENLLLDKY